MRRKEDRKDELRDTRYHKERNIRYRVYIIIMIKNDKKTRS